MSGVLTLKARGVKRALDEMVVETPTASCSPGRFALRPPAHAFKRTRIAPVGTPPRGATPPRSPAAPQPPPPQLSREELAALARHVPKRLKRVVQRYANGQVCAGEKLFTVGDVREIVTSVVAEREHKLGEEFARMLEEKLAQQFRDFSRYNEDYLARQSRARDCSYLS